MRAGASRRRLQKPLTQHSMASVAPKLITWAPVGSMHGSSTPFGLKVELAMRLAGITYTVEPGNPLNSKSMPKQKVSHARLHAHATPFT